MFADALMDSHCHLDFAPFDGDRDLVLAECQQLGIERLLLPGVTAPQWTQLAALSAQHAQLCFTAGLHPYWVAEHSEDDLQQLAQLLANPPAQLVGVGECGLDRMLAEPDFDKQLHLFEAQLQLAQQFKLPVVIHVRKAHSEVQQLLKRYPVQGVIHAFSGSYELGCHYIELGMYLGIGGTLTYPRAQKTRRAVAQLPLERLLLETDAPEMPPYGFQGQRNQPQRLLQVVASLAALRTEPRAALLQQLWHNSQLLFFPSNQGH